MARDEICWQHEDICSIVFLSKMCSLLIPDQGCINPRKSVGCDAHTNPTSTDQDPPFCFAIFDLFNSGRCKLGVVASLCRKASGVLPFDRGAVGFSNLFLNQ